MTSDVAVIVDFDDPIPPFEQIRRQITRYIKTGVISESDRLPAVRQLAKDLGVAPGTVARAYKELEAAGLVTTRRGAGTRPAAGAATEPADDWRCLIPLADQVVSEAKNKGLSINDALAAVQAAWDD